jgi:hypothetical protein
VTGIRELAARTPPGRERHVDLLRAAAITAVVIGHWLLTAVTYDQSGRLVGFSALREVTWAHPVTWLFQVMPVFFMVGGFANAASLQAYRDRHAAAGDAGWLLDRGARLLRPTTVLVVVLAAAALVAGLAGADPEQAGAAVWLASLPLWFLAAYLAMVGLTPVMWRLHRRAGLAVLVALLTPVLAGDLLRFRYGVEALGYGNYLFAWLAIHQVGFAWRDGRLPARPAVAVPLLAGGLGGLVGLTVFGPYPVSMVTVPGAEVQNSSPPTLALLALACAQLGLALLLRDPAQRWLRRPRVWLVVVAANSVVLTVYLWHLTAAALVSLGLHLAGVLPTPPVGSVTWLLWRVPWIALLAVVLAGLVAIFGRVETRAAARTPVPGRAGPDGQAEARRGGWTPVVVALARPVPLLVAAVAGYAATVLGLVWQAAAGPGQHGPFALPTGALLLYLAGAGTLRAARAARDSGSAPVIGRAGGAPAR